MAKLDPFSVHEALDRTHLLATTFHDFIVTHAFVEATPDLRDRAARIADQLSDLYQAIGQLAGDDPTDDAAVAGPL